MTKNIGKNFLKCLICLSSHSHRIAGLFYAQIHAGEGNN